MSNRDEIARKMMEKAGTLLPPDIPVVRTTDRVYPTWRGVPQSVPSTAGYAPYPGFHASPNIEDRTGELGGGRRAMGMRTGIDHYTKQDTYMADMPTKNPLTTALGLDAINAYEAKHGQDAMFDMLARQSAGPPSGGELKPPPPLPMSEEEYLRLQEQSAGLDEMVPRDR